MRGLWWWRYPSGCPGCPGCGWWCYPSIYGGKPCKKHILAMRVVCLLVRVVLVFMAPGCFVLVWLLGGARALGGYGFTPPPLVQIMAR